MQRNRRKMIILIVLSIFGLSAFAFTYRVIAGQINGNGLTYFGGAQAGY